jgi:hypothetical protein
VTGNLSVGASNQFTVNAASGNTQVAGTLTLSPLNSAGILTNNASGVVSSLANSTGVNGEVLTLVGGLPAWVAPTGTASRVTWITATNATWTPSAGTLALFVECVGGGGGGAGGNGSTTTPSGGGAGAYAATYIATPAASYAVTIGAAGAGGVGNANGTSATDTSFGSACVADGGSGGINMAAATTATAQLGGLGGLIANSSGDVERNGTAGGPGIRLASAQGVSGFGGDSVFGTGGRGRVSAGAGDPGTGYGSGGAGAMSTANGNQTGGAGTPGIVRVTEFK